ncbi:MAG: GNAT family N-acetyltransferase [Alphaproteobacteria bacterium]|jgi:RimJ/RimL family protein N-acetyltransferase|nr:GNAT family N-acetyltransferase [Alphaproteobacteria bacterium]
MTSHPHAGDDDLASARNRRPVGKPAVVMPIAPVRPQSRALTGRFGGVAPIDADRHAAALYAAGHEAGGRETIWTYKMTGPFDSAAAMRDWLTGCAACEDPLFFAVLDAAATAQGMAALLNLRPDFGAVELGHVWFATAHQRSRAATEALVLLMRHVFDACGYRRLEWKCDAANQASRRAALRLGFRFEGVFLNHMVIRGRNRDTAWYSLLDGEWPGVRAATDAWLAPENFDADGAQRTALSALTRALW